MNDKKSDRVLFENIHGHLLNDATPSIFLKQATAAPEFRRHPFDSLLKLKLTEQNEKHHPEGNVWIHTLMVVDEAAKRRADSKNPAALMWAALLHDIGKYQTTKRRNGKITSYNHDRVGARLVKEFLSELTGDSELIREVVALTRWHMQILFVVKDMSFADVEGMRRETDIREIALLGLCDRLGRGGCDEKAERENIRLFMEKCGYDGELS